MNIYQFFKKTIVYYIPSITTMVFGLITFPILAKILPLDDFGKLDLINTINAIFVVITGLGAGIVVQQIIYRGDHQNIKDNLGNQFIINTSSFLIFSLLFVLLHKYILPKSFNTQLSVLMIGYILAVASASNFTKYVNEIYRYRSWAGRFISVQIIPMIGMFVTVVFLYKVDALSLINLLKGYIIINLLYLIIMIYPVSQEINLTLNLKNTWKYLKLGLLSLPIYAVILINRYVDRWFIINYNSIGDLGLYAINVKLAMLAFGVIAALNNVFLPEFMKDLRDGKNFEIDFIIEITLIIFMSLSLCIFFLGKEFVCIFSKPVYFENYLTVFFSSMFILFLFLNHLIYPFVLYENKVKYMGISYTVGAIVNICVNYAFIPRIGYPAAALSSLMSQVSIFCICLFLAWHHKKHFLFLRQAILILISLSTGFMIINSYNNQIYLSEIILKMILVILTFLSLALVSKTVSTKRILQTRYRKLTVE